MRTDSEGKKRAEVMEKYRLRISCGEESQANLMNSLDWLLAKKYHGYRGPVDRYVMAGWIRWASTVDLAIERLKRITWGENKYERHLRTANQKSQWVGRA